MGVHLYKQTVDGSDYVLSDTIYIEENTYTFENLYQGYTVSQYSTSDPPTNWRTATVGTTVSGFTDLHVRFNRNTYNLIFQYADGTPYNTYSVNFGADLSGYADQALPPDTSSTAYTGWMIDLNGAKMPAGDVYVYPSNHDASKPVYQVTLDLDGGAFPESWYSSSQGRDPELQNSFSTFYTVKSNDYIIEEYVNVEKKFKPDADGNYYYICVTPEFAAAHPDLPHIARYVEKDSTEASLYAACLAMYGGSPQTFSPMEESDGRYEFLGWYTSSDTEYDFDTPVSGDIVLTAKWQLIPAETRTDQQLMHLCLHSNFIADGQTAEQTMTLDDLQQNHRVVLAAYSSVFARSGYKLKGWSTVPNSSVAQYGVNAQLSAYLDPRVQTEMQKALHSIYMLYGERSYQLTYLFLQDLLTAPHHIS